MNVTEIVRELKMTKEEFFPLAKDLGFDIGERAIKVDDQIAIKLITAIKQKRKKDRRKSLFADQKEEKVVKEKTEEELANEKVVEVTNPITTKAFADVVGKEVTDMISVLVRNGIMATINQNLDFETVSIIAEDMGFTAKLVDATGGEVEAAREEKLQSALSADTDSKTLAPRPPVIVVMGHVDHGKTKLLDTIRQTDVADDEAGGITQTIGAYQITHNKRKLTFIDTPGHAAFTAMRSRGANVADMAILVIAADDGLKPQTVEAIHILEKANLPFVVAINKIDKEGADIDKVKTGLTELNLNPEDWGGSTICVPISAKANTNIDGLLEMVLLVADMHKEKIQANPDRDPVGTIIESRIDKDAGSVATVLVQTGTLKVGEFITVGDVSGKIKAMKTWKGDRVQEALPSMPVQFLGLKGAPVVGDILAVGNPKEARKKKKNYQSFGYLRTTQDHESGKTKLRVIVKADTLGSLEAVIASLNEITHDDVQVDIVKQGLGNFTEKDIDQAVASKAKLVGFNVQISPAANDYALGTATTVESFSIIYKLLEYVEEELEQLLAPEILYNKIGEVKIKAIFRTTTKFVIAGGRVETGLIKNKAITKLTRNGEVVGEAKIVQLKSGPEDVPQVNKGNECGFKLEVHVPVEEGDSLEIYETEEKKRTLR